MAATPYSYRQYAGNGSNKSFAVPFPYLLKSHVRVYLGFNLLDGTYTVELAETSGFTWTSGTAIQTVAAPASGQTLTVIRQTPNSQQVVQYQDGSTLIANDLNTSDLQNLYVVQEQQDRNDAGIAVSLTAKTAGEAAAAAATTATTAANAATTAANTATTAANTATTASTAATSTANTALANSQTAQTNASAAVTTANTASTNATAAVTTANTASSNASTALSTANTAASNASTALSTANTAASNASTALATANTASTNATTAVSTANTASTNASAAVTTSGTASSNASTALSTANTANTKADQALSAVSNSINYTLVANVAGIPASPANDTYVEVGNSAGIESFTPLAGKPAGFVGDSGLSVRIRYTTAGATWNWQNYYPNNAETRYLKLTGGTLTGDINLAGAPSSNLHPATKLYTDTAVGAKLDTATAASTYQTQAGMSSYLTTASASSTYLSQSSASSTYLPTATAASTYQTQAGMSSYLTTATAGTTYQTQAGMGSYLTTTAAGSTYQPLSGMTSYAALGTAQSFTKAQRGTPVALTDAATVQVDLSLGNHYTLGLGGNRTLGAPTNQTAGQSGVIVITNGGANTLAFASVWKFPGGTAPTVTASAVDVLAYYVESSTRITARIVSDVK